MARAGGGRVTVNLRGEKEVIRKLKRLEAKAAKKIIRRGLRAGAKIFKPEVESNAPIGETWDLVESIKIKSGKRSRNYLSILVQSGEGHFTGDQYYGGFSEYGTQHQPAQEWMARAFESKGDEAQDKSLKVIKDGLIKEAKR